MNLGNIIVKYDKHYKDIKFITEIVNDISYDSVLYPMFIDFLHDCAQYLKKYIGSTVDNKEYTIVDITLNCEDIRIWQRKTLHRDQYWDNIWNTIIDKK